MISKIVLLSAPSDIHWCVGGNGCFSCESLDLKVTLEKEVLTVNGKRYVIPYKDDSIKVVDDRGRIEVEVNGQLAEPKGGS